MPAHRKQALVDLGRFVNNTLNQIFKIAVDDGKGRAQLLGRTEYKFVPQLLIYLAVCFVANQQSHAGGSRFVNANGPQTDSQTAMPLLIAHGHLQHKLMR